MSQLGPFGEDSVAEIGDLHTAIRDAVKSQFEDLSSDLQRAVREELRCGLGSMSPAFSKGNARRPSVHSQASGRLSGRAADDGPGVPVMKPLRRFRSQEFQELLQYHSDDEDMLPPQRKEAKKDTKRKSLFANVWNGGASLETPKAAAAVSPGPRPPSSCGAGRPPPEADYVAYGDVGGEDALPPPPGGGLGRQFAAEDGHPGIPATSVEHWAMPTELQHMRTAGDGDSPVNVEVEAFKLEAPLCTRMASGTESLFGTTQDADVPGADGLAAPTAPKSGWVQGAPAPSRESVSGEPTRGKSRNRAEDYSTPMERAMGLMPTSNLNTTGFADQSRFQRCALRVVKDPRFEILTTIIIVASAAHIGIQTDYMARNKNSEITPLLRAFDVVFCIIFTIELAMRIFAFRTRFFHMYGWGWNVFDTFLIVSQLVEELLLLLYRTNMMSINSANLFRVIRVLRTVRTIRVLHIMRFATDLQMLVSCLLKSSRAFIWSLGLIMLMLYTLAVYWTQLATMAQVEADNPEEAIGLSKWYGSVPRSVMSLFQALTGGVDWNDIMVPLSDHVSPWMGLWFGLYIAFALILVMNVVAAMFVESAIEHSSKVREMHKLSSASRLFRSLDVDSSGFITFDEVVRHTESQDVLEFFRSIDVDVSEAKCLFDLLDVDGSGEIEFSEFLSGCLRLQGPAKAMDMVVSFYQLNKSIERLAQDVALLHG